MTKKRDLRLRVNEKLYAELMEWSAEELRSMNGLVEYLLTEAVRKRKKNAKLDPLEDEPNRRLTANNKSSL